jgi:hypothetical protein
MKHQQVLEELMIIQIGHLHILINTILLQMEQTI